MANSDAPELAPEPASHDDPLTTDARQRYAATASLADESETIRRYAPLVKRMAMHLRGRLPDSVQLDDLVQAGLIAIVRGMRNERIATMSEAALRRTITNAMIDEARREAWAPVRTVRLAKSAGAAMRAVKQRTGRDGSDEEIAEEMHISLGEYHHVLVDIAGIRLLQLDDFEDSTEERLRISGNQENEVHRKWLMTTLAEGISALPEREKLVVSLYYEQELNMEEVGEVLGLDKSTVCRAHSRALLILRNALGEGSAAPSARRRG